MSEHEHQGCKCPSKECDILVSQAQAQNNLANFWLGRNRPEIAESFIAQAEHLLYLAGAEKVPARVWLLTSKCDIESRGGNKAKAYELAKQAFDMAVEVFGETDVSCAIARCNLGEVSTQTDRVAEGIDLLEAGLAVLREALVTAEGSNADYLNGAIAGFEVVLGKVRPAAAASEAAPDTVSGEAKSDTASAEPVVDWSKLALVGPYSELDALEPGQRVVTVGPDQDGKLAWLGEGEEVIVFHTGDKVVVIEV